MALISRLKEQTINPETKIEYTIDLTRQYHNLLQKEEEGNTQSYLWDGNVAGIREDMGTASHYYFQDELGSPIRLMDKNGELAESYGYDEFGQDLFWDREETAGRSMTGSLQPFGYTGYQYDRTAGTYYAQAREYRAELGRFAAVDTIKGFTMAPYTLNEYGYCWGNPMVLVDLNGQSPKKKSGQDEFNVPSEDIPIGDPTVTICVDAPNPNTRDAISEDGVGHTFLIVDYGNGTSYTFGFYPKKQLGNKDVAFQRDVKGRVYNDEGHGYDESITYNITKEQADQLLDFANNYDKSYNIVNNNCTTFAVEALESIGIDTPIKEHIWTLPDNIDEITGFSKEIIRLLGGYDLKGYSPGDAAVDIREFKEECELDE